MTRITHTPIWPPLTSLRSRYSAVRSTSPTPPRSRRTLLGALGALPFALLLCGFARPLPAAEDPSSNVHGGEANLVLPDLS
ncbi:MAG: hypothetical protein E6905_05540, partial [Actinomyces sp.]|nr:hypothetical protein [Actinomyces sp.]